MTFMVIEHFRPGEAPQLYRRFRDRGRMAPEGLRYIASWVDLDFHRCFQVMEADHWCCRSRVLLVLEGELVMELEDGARVILTADTSWQIADNAAGHKPHTATGANLVIVD